MSRLQYVGLDIHKKVIAYCIKTQAGMLREVGRGNRNRANLEVARRLVGLLLAIDKSGVPYDTERNLRHDADSHRDADARQPSCENNKDRISCGAGRT